MALITAPQLSRSEVLDASFLIVRRYSLMIIRAALPAIGLAVLLDAVIYVVTVGSDASLLGMPVSLVAWGMAEGMAIAACWDLLHRNPPTVARSWKRVSARLTAIAVGYSLKWLLITTGLFLLLAPGVYLMARWFAVPTASIAEEASLRMAFRRSRELSRNNLKRILLTLGIVESAVMILIIGIAALVPGGSLETPSGLQTVTQWILWVAFLPLRTALATVLYLEIRTRSEGYDLQVALRDLVSAA